MYNILWTEAQQLKKSEAFQNGATRKDSIGS